MKKLYNIGLPASYGDASGRRYALQQLGPNCLGMLTTTLTLGHIPTVPVEIVRAAPDSTWVIASSIAAGAVAIVTLVLALATL